MHNFFYDKLQIIYHVILGHQLLVWNLAWEREEGKTPGKKLWFSKKVALFTNYYILDAHMYVRPKVSKDRLPVEWKQISIWIWRNLVPVVSWYRSWLGSIPLPPIVVLENMEKFICNYYHEWTKKYCCWQMLVGVQTFQVATQATFTKTNTIIHPNTSIVHGLLYFVYIYKALHICSVMTKNMVINFEPCKIRPSFTKR